eukprot:5736234-Prymnesium_polylepis.1
MEPRRAHAPMGHGQLGPLERDHATAAASRPPEGTPGAAGTPPPSAQDIGSVGPSESPSSVGHPTNLTAPPHAHGLHSHGSAGVPRASAARASAVVPPP